jgi:hypothetical protein
MPPFEERSDERGEKYGEVFFMLISRIKRSRKKLEILEGI